jgi:hypothetical protein
MTRQPAETLLARRYEWLGLVVQHSAPLVQNVISVDISNIPVEEARDLERQGLAFVVVTRNYVHGALLTLRSGELQACRPIPENVAVLHKSGYRLQ